MKNVSEVNYSVEWGVKLHSNFSMNAVLYTH